MQQGTSYLVTSTWQVMYIGADLEFQSIKLFQTPKFGPNQVPRCLIATASTYLHRKEMRMERRQQLPLKGVQITSVAQARAK